MAGLDSNAMSELLTQLGQLGREAAVLDGRLRAAQAAVAEASGRDPSEQVRVVLDAAGRITTVEFKASWRSRLDAGELTGAVLAAHQEAGRRRLETWASEVSRTAGDTAPSAPPEQRPPPHLAGHGSVHDLWYLLQDASDRLEDLSREATTRGSAVTTGHDPGHHVTATLTGAELTGLSLAPPWPGQAGAEEIGSALTAAIADGYRAVDDLAAQSLTRQWPFPELDRFTSDPAALLTALGLPTPGAPDEQR
ncbi:hypothetical protein [Actinoplanes sp. NPDC026619]|uniref:hypothetical protein n=1 Tax=Actinoplanes sp. NPDC026619 TaxID=3155798 RepID=UPI0033F7089E